MPYVRDDSASPRRRNLSRSPDLPSDQAGPSKPKKPRVKMTEADIQRYHVEKLLAKPDQEVALPEPTREKVVRDPVDLVKNVQGSSSGAGSGEFHVYKHARKREWERSKLFEEKQRALDEQAAFKARQEARDAAADAKTAKNRAKRQKRKEAAKKGAKGVTNGTTANGTGVDPSRKLAGGGSGVVFKRPDDESDEEDEREADEEQGPTESTSQQMAAAAPIPIAEEPKIVVLDDD